jgi:hypothetical protein
MDEAASDVVVTVARVVDDVETVPVVLEQALSMATKHRAAVAVQRRVLVTAR